MNVFNGWNTSFIRKGQASRDGGHIPNFDSKQSCPMRGGSDSILLLKRNQAPWEGGQILYFDYKGSSTKIKGSDQIFL